MAILDVTTLGAITRKTPSGFYSNLVQRECIGGATSTPVQFRFSFKNGDRGGGIFVF